jgi:hypothetical protein
MIKMAKQDVNIGEELFVDCLTILVSISFPSPDLVQLLMDTRTVDPNDEISFVCLRETTTISTFLTITKSRLSIVYLKVLHSFSVFVLPCAHDEWEIILFFLVDIRIKKSSILSLSSRARTKKHDEDDFFPFIEKRFSSHETTKHTIDSKKEQEELFKTHGSLDSN